MRILLFLVVAACATGTPVSTPVDSATYYQRYVASYDLKALLDEPLVAAELKDLLGPKLDYLLLNLNVTGSIGVVAGALTASGNAPHRGGEEEAVLCFNPERRVVEAAIYSRGSITVYAREARYPNLTLCIKDWITDVNAAHAARLRQPGNVRLHPDARQ
jgi:hypothetical protein